jgi:hypothetical protein
MRTTDSAARRRTLRQAHAYMFPEAEQRYITEAYVATPPAARITDEANNVWTLGYQYQKQADAPDGEFAFNVLLNGRDVGEFASRIERRNGKIRIFTRNGFKVWNGHSFF